MLFNLSQFTVWLGSQIYPQRPVILLTAQFSVNISDLNIQLCIRELWERCDQKLWKDVVEEKFWLRWILKFMKVLDRKNSNKLRCNYIETTTACGDNGVEAGSPRWVGEGLSGPRIKLWRPHILFCVAFDHPFPSLLSSYFPHSLANFSYRGLGSSLFWRAIKLLAAFCHRTLEDWKVF